MTALLTLPSGPAKTQLANVLALRGAWDPTVRATAVALVRGKADTDHVGRITRLWEFVRNGVPYHREPIEMFHAANVTLQQGGDCDDHAILLRALGWALRYPGVVIPYGSPENPAHYATRLGYPPSQEPFGNARTTWVTLETTIPALYGEEPPAALDRLRSLGYPVE